MPSGGLSAIVLLAVSGLCVSEEAIQCPPCSEEKLSRCKVPMGCEELVREPGCGCCATCALSKGTSCGVYTARCGSGLRCYPPRGIEKPLHTLMNGQGICMDLTEIQSIQDSLQPIDDSESPNSSLNLCNPQDRKCNNHKLTAKTRNQQNNGGRSRILANPVQTETRIMGSCHSELYRALDRLAAATTRTQEDLFNIPIPNCDRNGNFHPKQCHPALDGQRGRCWCVDRKTGMKIHGGPEPKGDLDCQALGENVRE
ncbi:insulin-like growth factor-binding protein 4 isoform X2 [Rhinatrema bivittatum]|uniref:insulin-like growth factor-binding protein 4 isoform X2 n=1 Tax=Rhinatrema bivittatum TaxID=194408 RepID=UPI001127D9B0|nr:insulin-like growth factor-binding protein 4 isoform X2 [Rhinatrema bivittatum]